MSKPAPAALSNKASGTAPDVTECDREPIHVPGAIQPHGSLMILDVQTLEAVAGAGELDVMFGADWLGRQAEALLGGAAAATLAGSTGTCRLETHDRLGDVIAFRAAEVWLVQMERSGLPMSSFDSLSWIEEVGAVFERSVSLLELCQRAAEAFRELTGFDRVMIYRFLDDDSGVVVADDVAPGLTSFRNHHFPASDIPRQARALYIRNRVRVIPDVHYQPQPIRPERFATVDLSDVELRSVSPTHIQYLKNMGVAASASISIVRDGVLWGLVACHNLTPRSIDAPHRRAAQIVAGGLARQIGAKEQAEDYRERIRVRADEDAISARLSAEKDPESLFMSASGDLKRMFDADGFAILHGSKLNMAGLCPDRDDVREVAEWVKRQGSAPYHTSSLPEDYAPAAEFRQRASGLLAITLSSKVPTVLLWFRAEEREIVEWAGNPHKAADLRPGEALTPRASFAAWAQIVDGRARPWSKAEVEAAHRLQAKLYDARQNRRIRDLADDLGIALADKDRLIAQKDTLLKEVNHRIQNSLQLVVSFLAMQARAEADDKLTEHLTEAQRRLSAVALVHRRLYADDNVQSVDLARYLGELIDDLRGSMGDEWSGQLTDDLAPLLISSDNAVQVGLVLVELVINAQKYAYDGAPGPISIVLEQHRARFRLIVADKGRGRSGTRKGFGARMLESMVKRLDGTMEETDNGPGLRIIVSAPVQALRVDQEARLEH